MLNPSWKKLVLLGLLLILSSSIAAAEIVDKHNGEILPFDSDAVTAQQAIPFPDDPTFDRYVHFTDYIQSFYRADASQLAEYAISATQAENILLRSRKDFDNDVLWSIAIRMATVTGNKPALENLVTAAKTLGKDKFDKEIKDALAAIEKETALTDVSQVFLIPSFPPATFAIPAFYSEDVNKSFSGENHPHAALSGEGKKLYEAWSTGMKNLADFAAKKPLSPEASKALVRIQTTVANNFTARLGGDVRGIANQLLVGRWETDTGRRAAIDANGNYTAYTPVGWNVFTYEFSQWDNSSGHLRVYNSDGYVAGNFTVFFRGINCMEWQGEGERRIYHRK